MNRKWIVIDTNVLISGFLKPDSTPKKALLKALHQGVLLESQQTYHELSTRISRSKFDKYTTDELRADYLRLLANNCVWIEPTETITDCIDDPDDNIFLELAVSGQASCIVSGDKHLLNMNPYRGIPILTSGQFLEWD